VGDCCACLVFHQGSCGRPQGFLSFSKKERFAFFRVVYGILVIVGKVCSFLILYGILVLVVKRRKKAPTMPSI
jgi:hypothetical protein